MVFKLWSELNVDAKKELQPDFGIRSWNTLSPDDKKRIWKYLEDVLFPTKLIEASENEWYQYNLIGRRKSVAQAIFWLNKSFKVNGYASNFHFEETFESALNDFYQIFLTQNENVVFELFSLYAKAIMPNQEQLEETDFEDQAYYEFDEFSKQINEVFIDFGLSVIMTRLGFVPRQDNKILTEIYDPVISYLSSQIFEKVNTLFKDAFSEYRKNTPNGYSTCVTHCVAAIEAFLQIIVKDKLGSGKLSNLIAEGLKKKILPDDIFTKEIFKTIEQIVTRERMETGDAHPKKSYATERNAKTILNISMIFLQHCIVK